jgi:hypothetical protein
MIEENNDDFFAEGKKAVKNLQQLRYDIKRDGLKVFYDKNPIEIQDVAEFIKEKADHRGWENAEYMAAYIFGQEKTLKAIQWLIDNPDPQGE